MGVSDDLRRFLLRRRQHVASGFGVGGLLGSQLGRVLGCCGGQRARRHLAGIAASLEAQTGSVFLPEADPVNNDDWILCHGAVSLLVLKERRKA